MSEPSPQEFIDWLIDKHPDIGLTEYQVEIMESCIDYKKKIFSGGFRSGRTFTLDLVSEYFKDEYPGCVIGH